MDHTTAWKVVALGAALVAAVTWQIAGHQAADAGHTFGTSNCQSNPPNCTYVYSSAGSNLIATQKSFAIHDYRFYENWPSSYETALDEAEFNWAKAAGPQAPMEPSSDHLTFSVADIFLRCPNQGDPSGACGIAIAYTCPLIPPNDQRPLQCDRFVDTARNVTGNETYVNPTNLDPEPYTTKVHVFAHELGHALRLAHHSSGVCLMNTQVTPVTGPSTLLECDLGFADPFSANELHPCDRDVDKWGINSVYLPVVARTVNSPACGLL